MSNVDIWDEKLNRCTKNVWNVENSDVNSLKKICRKNVKIWNKNSSLVKKNGKKMEHLGQKMREIWDICLKMVKFWKFRHLKETILKENTKLAKEIEIREKLDRWWKKSEKFGKFTQNLK